MVGVWVSVVAALVLLAWGYSCVNNRSKRKKKTRKYLCRKPWHATDGGNEGGARVLFKSRLKHVLHGTVVEVNRLEQERIDKTKKLT